jgi:adenosylhomocysteine nucleosidase
MIAIVVALDSEVKFFLENVQNKNEKILGGKKVIEGTILNKQVVVSVCGIGKVNAAMTTQLLIDKYSPDLVLNFGTCGGTNDGVSVKEYYYVDKCCQFDFDLRELDGVPLGYIQEYKTAYFNTTTDRLDFLDKTSLATADRFTNDINDIKAINDVGCSLRDMEGGAIAQVCLSNNVPLLMIKGITDVYNSGTAQEQFFKNLKAVSDGFPDVIFKALDAIKETTF